METPSSSPVHPPRPYWLPHGDQRVLDQDHTIAAPTPSSAWPLVVLLIVLLVVLVGVLVALVGQVAS